jgi:phosphate/phosphite/phosphonate ABC transporter binding protein
VSESETIQPRSLGQVGRYQLLRRIAIGGMAEVFIAVEQGDHEFERLVVIKRILAHLSVDRSFLEMFMREARIAAQINHPNVVQIYGLGNEGGLPYIAMEFVDGSTLKELAGAAQKAGRVVPMNVGLGLAIQACAGAHAAHELMDAHGQRMEIVHRDLSPHNLMVTPEGHLKVLDFGIAKATQGMDKTRTGVLKGKISYLSPEQCMQDGLDRRSDLFTLAGVIYELLCFERPFQGKSDLNTMQNIVKGQRGNIRDHRPDVPEEFALALERSLETNAEGRFNTADEMRRALVHVAALHEMDVGPDAIAAFIGDVVGPEHLSLRHDLEPIQSSMRSYVSLEPVEKKSRFGVLLALSGWITGAIGFLSSAVLVFLLLFVVLNPLRWWIPAHPLNEPPDYTGTPLRVQLAPTVDSEILLKDFEPIRRYLSHKLQRPVVMAISGSYEQTADAIVDGSADLAFLPPFIYTKTHSVHPGVRVIATKIDEGSTGADSLLLVRGADPATGPSDLIGRTLCHSDENSTTSYVLPRAYLRRQGIDPDTQMKAHISGNHLQVVRDILTETCDVGAIFSGAFLAAESAGVDVAALRVLGVAGRTPHDAVVVGPLTPIETEEAVLTALLALDVSRDLGQESLGTVERISGFKACDDSVYDPLRDAIELARKFSGGPGL